MLGCGVGNNCVEGHSVGAVVLGDVMLVSTLSRNIALEAVVLGDVVLMSFVSRVSVMRGVVVEATVED